MTLKEYCTRSKEWQSKFNEIRARMDVLIASKGGEIDSQTNIEFRSLCIEQDALIKQLQKLSKDAGFSK